MNTEIKCDRCGTIAELYRHINGWRCPKCIWNERENLIAWSNNLLKTIGYHKIFGSDKQTVVISRKSIIALSEVVKEVSS